MLSKATRELLPWLLYVVAILAFLAWLGIVEA
jgi:hypothetical protein